MRTGRRDAAVNAAAAPQPARNPADAARTARLDRDTPKWPELRVTLGDPSTIYISGIAHPLDSEDPQADAVAQAADVARDNGHPIRMTATDADTGTVDRMIVTADRSVVLLDHATPAATTAENHPPTTARKSPGRRKAAKPAAKKPSTGFLAAFPPRLRPVIKWGGPAFVLLVVAALVVGLVVKGHANHRNQQASTVDHPAPPAGQLYTQYPPPGWSAQAAWTLPIADHTSLAVDDTTGTTALLTPNDRTTSTTEKATATFINSHDAGYLSVIDATGRTLWATAIGDDQIVAGPKILTLDNRQVVLVGGSTNVTYWPLTGGNPTTVDLPADTVGALNLAGDNVGIQLADNRIAYLDATGFRTLDALPLTEMAFALDGRIISAQSETGAWWTQRADSAPTATRPAAPTHTYGLDQILTITPDHVILSWNGTNPADQGNTSPTYVLAAYRTTDAALIAQTTVDTRPVTSADTLFADTVHGLTVAGDTILTDNPTHPTLAAITGFVPTAAVDQVYGTQDGHNVVVDSAGHISTVTDSTLVPVGTAAGQLLVESQDQLYALPPADSPVHPTGTPSAASAAPSSSK